MVIFLADGAFIFKIGTTNLPNKAPRKPSDWIIFEIWALLGYTCLGNWLQSAVCSFIFYFAVGTNW